MKQTFFPPILADADLHRALVDWFDSPRGRRLQAQESACVSAMMRGVFGHYLLQAGFPLTVDCPGIRQQVHLGGRDEGSVQVIGRSSAMPFQAESMDHVLLIHALDFSDDPHQVLREADRVLMPEGQLIIVGFNPFSLWGLGRLLHPRRGQIPWSASFLARGRVEDWLRLLGFSLADYEFLAMAPPERLRGWRARHRMLQGLVAPLWTPMARVFVVRAVKRVIPPTRIRPSWKLKPILLDRRLRQGELGRAAAFEANRLDGGRE